MLTRAAQRKCYSCLRTAHSTDGFTLLETLVSVTLVSILLAVAVRVVSMTGEMTRFELSTADALYQGIVAKHMLMADVHSAKSIAANGNELTMLEVDGQSVSYWVNEGGQLVRVGSSGGTEVTATGISSWDYTIRDGRLEVKLNWACGVEESFRSSSLVSVDSLP